MDDPGPRHALADTPAGRTMLRIALLVNNQNTTVSCYKQMLAIITHPEFDASHLPLSKKTLQKAF